VKKLAITLLLAVVLAAVPGCPRHWAHAAVAGAAVGVIAADAIHHTRYRSDYYHRGPGVSVTFGAPNHSGYYNTSYYSGYDTPYYTGYYNTSYYPGYQATYYSSPRVVYRSPQRTRVVPYSPRPRTYYPR